MKKMSLVVVGLFFGCIAAELVLRIGGFFFMAVQELVNMRALQNHEHIRILALGESTTALGEKSSAPGAPDTWPALLEEALNNGKSEKKYSVINRGVPGITTTGILANLSGDLKTYKPDIVISMMGYNDGNVKPHARTPYLLTRLRVFKLSCYSWLWLTGTIPRMCSSVAPWQISRTPGVPVLNETILIAQKDAHPRNFQSYIKLADYYTNEGRYKDALAVLESAKTLDSCSDELLIRYGNIFRYQADYKNAAMMYENALSCNHASSNAAGELGYLRILEHNDTEAESLLMKSIEYDPGNVPTYNKLGDLLRKQKRYVELEHIAKKLIRQYPDESWPLVELEKVMRETGRQAEANDVSQKVMKINPIVADNYMMLKEIVRSNGALLVAVQYPMRDVAQLKAMLGADGVIYVDNKPTFEKAIAAKGYDAYFTDTFGGDFGHATRKGNELIARNVSEAIAPFLP